MDTDKINELEARSIAKKAAKDSIFRDLFEEPEYLLQLYQALHPEDKTTTVNDIELVSIQNVLLNQMYNDLGFLVGRTQATLLILLEVQSTWSINILVRILFYLVITLKEYVEKHRMNLYGSKKIALPTPELYLIYTGSRKNRPEWLSLSKEYFSGSPAFLDLRVKVIYDGVHGDIINQYVTFTKIYDEQIRLHGRTRQAVLETINICKNKDILKQYLETRQKEVVNIMMTLFDQNFLWDRYVEGVREELAEELTEELTEELRPKLKKELAEELTPKLTEELKPKLTEELKPKLKAEVEAEVMATMKAEVEASVLKEGIAQGMEKSVLTMKKKGLSNQSIADLLDLSLDDVNRWCMANPSGAQPLPQ